MLACPGRTISCGWVMGSGNGSNGNSRRRSRSRSFDCLIASKWPCTIRRPRLTAGIVPGCRRGAFALFRMLSNSPKSRSINVDTSFPFGSILADSNACCNIPLRLGEPLRHLANQERD